jgi:hypothetical protein
LLAVVGQFCGLRGAVAGADCLEPETTNGCLRFPIPKQQLSLKLPLMEEEQDRLANRLHGPDRDKQAAEARRAVLQCRGPVMELPMVARNPSQTAYTRAFGPEAEIAEIV